MNACLFSSLFFLSCGAMDAPLAIPATTLPNPFKINSGPSKEPTMEHFKVARRCTMSAEIVKKKDKRVYLRVKLFYRNMKIMQNEYELDLNKLSKL